MDINQSASAKTALQTSGSDILVKEQFANTIHAYVDELFDVWFGEAGNAQLEGLFRSVDQKFPTYTMQSKVRPSGTVPLRRDADDLAFIEPQEGFGYTFQTYMYGQAVKHERELQEIDDVGAITDRYEWLMENSKRTLKNALADVFNRAVAPTNAPFLCLDGMYMIDSARPNPDPKAPAWSNEEATGDVTATALFTASVNAHNTIGPNGDYIRQKIKKILLPIAYDKTAWTLLNTDRAVGSANNDANWASGGRFNYEVLDDLTSRSIFYLLDDAKSKKNGLQIRWRVRPGLADINFENPDVMGKRIRFGFGLGCLDPRYVWRGGALNAL
jgi:hypothetical protein